MLRLFAEFDNYRRRTSKESIELMQTAGKEVISSLLDVLDDVIVQKINCRKVMPIKH